MHHSALIGHSNCARACLTFLIAKGVNDFNRLYFKGRAAVLTEHGAHRIEHYLSLGQVCCSYLYEDILCVQADLHQMGTVDHGATEQNNMRRLLRSANLCGFQGGTMQTCCKKYELMCTNSALLRAHA